MMEAGTDAPRDRAHLSGPLPGGGFKWCIFPCQKLDEHGKRLARECRVPVDPRYNGNVWSVTGTADAPTLSPSIDCASKPCWHGIIENGVVRP